MRSWSRCALIACLVFLLSARAFAQQPADNGAASPEPAPEATESGVATAAPKSNQLPPVEVIQKQAQAAPNAAPKQAAPKKKQVAAPPPPPTTPPLPVTPFAAGTGGMASGSVMMSPGPESDIPIGKFPGAVGRAGASDIQRTGDPSVPEQLQNSVPSAILSDAQGNVFQRDLQFRGFDASPVNGQAQGIAVYQNGVRINESFGDIVNWDFLPDSAINGITIIGANPVFGLNAIGGAAVIVMRDGFNFQGVETDTRFGSFGRIQGSLAAGASSGAWGAFVSLERIQDDGFRDFSEAEIKRMYADLGVRRDGKEFHLNFTGADNEVGVTAAAPIELLDLDWARTFTSPQTTDNSVRMLSLNGSVKATPTLTFSGDTYYRWFKQSHVDGNIAEPVKCTDHTGGPNNGKKVVCAEDDDDPSADPEPLVDADGDTLLFNKNLSYGSIDRTSQDASSYGASLQAVEKAPLLSLPNQFLIGASYDHGNVKYGANSELGFFAPKFVVNGFDDPFFLAGPDDFVPRNLTTINDYVGIYFSDTIDLTSRLALTVGGRWNYARIQIKNNSPLVDDDDGGGEDDDDGAVDLLSGTHEFYRFNPMAGLTFKLAPGLTAYGSYAEANRAPTAAELACADPINPCLIESFLTADPPLRQVVSRTFELGVRGDLATWHGDQKLEWTAGVFRTENQDDILAIASESNGRGFFTNAGDTLRQGVELGLQYQDRRLYAYANYAFIDATFRTANVFASPDNPNEDAHVDCATGDPNPDPDDPVCIKVNPGDRLPGIPRHRFKAGFDYWMTSKWKFGADVVAASDQYFLGDEGNDNAPLADYATVDLRTSYNITEHVQIYGLIDNLFDTRYGLFGTFYNGDAAHSASKPDPVASNLDFDSSRSITPAPPFAIYGGLKVKY